MTRRTALKFLQIDDPNPSDLEIKKAFKKLATTFHPDKNNTTYESIYNNLFQQLNESYSVLIASSFESDEEAAREEKAFRKNREEYLNRVKKEQETKREEKFKKVKRARLNDYAKAKAKAKESRKHKGHRKFSFLKRKSNSTTKSRESIFRRRNA